MLQEAVFLPPVLHRTNPTTTITVDLTVVITMVITITTVITIMVITITVFVLRIEIVGEVKNVAHHLMDKGLVPTLQIIMDNNKNVVSSAFSKNTFIWSCTTIIKFSRIISPTCLSNSSRIFLPPVLHRTSQTTIITVDLTVVITMVITKTTVITIMVITITVFVLRIEIVGEVKNVAHHLMDKGLVPTLQIIMDNNKNVVSSAFF